MNNAVLNFDVFYVLGFEHTRLPAKQGLQLYKLKQHKPWFHEEYLQLLVQWKQAKIQPVTGSQPKQCRETKQCKALSL
jgi:hypothetical protein